MDPPALAKFSISSVSGANPSSRMSAAYPFWARRTPSTLRNTSVSLPEPTAALATTNATVALSLLSLAWVRLTQNRLAMSVLLSTDEIHRMLLRDQRVAGHAAPRREILRRAEVTGGQAQHLPRAHRGQPRAQ